MKIKFLKTTDNSMKLRRLGASIEYYFLKNKRVLVVVPSEAAGEYLDKFLWEQPKESFVPHCFSNDKLNEEVVITTENSNLNNAEILINLCPDRSPIADQFEFVFELWDETDQSRKELSEKRFNAYAAAGAEVELIP